MEQGWLIRGDDNGERQPCTAPLPTPHKALPLLLLYLRCLPARQAAAAASDDPASGATVVGTFGFMAPEQLRGEATPASDLYSLGATLLSLVSGRPPSSFPADRLHIDFSSGAGLWCVCLRCLCAHHCLPARLHGQRASFCPAQQTWASLELCTAPAPAWILTL